MRSGHPLSSFNIIFVAVLMLTISSGGAAITIANRPTISKQQERILDSAIAIWTMGTTTLIGLLSSRSSGNGDDHDDE